MKKHVLRLLAPAALALLLAAPASASGAVPDTLTVKVGYFGGPYYEKAVFTIDELQELEVHMEYTFLDRMPAVGIAHVTGVRLAGLMDAAGIDLNSIREFHFRTLDGVGSDVSRSKASLIDTPRYCYYSLPDNYDDEEQTANEYAGLNAEPVETVIAWAEDWRRCIAGAAFGSDYLNLDGSRRFRLVYGQTNPEDITASEEYYWIYEIVAELGGAPVLTLDASVLEGEVGSVLRTEAGVTADSAVLEHERVLWSSSDESVAAVDENGNITVRSEGTAVITANFAGVTASVTVNGAPGGEGAAAGEPENGESAPADSANAPANEPPSDQEPDNTVQEPVEETPPEPPETAAPVKPEVEPVTHPLKPVTITETSEGGVQNWRDTEMSETATALPDIEVDSTALRLLGICAGALFLGSGMVYAGVFYQNVKGKTRGSVNPDRQKIDKIRRLW